MSTTTGLGSGSERDCLRTLLSKQLVPAVLLVVFGAIILHSAAGLDFDAIFTAVRDIGPLQWGVAVIGAAVSFWAIGRMDVIAHRLLDTGVPARVAQLSGIASVATAQLTGFGLLTGTLARWRVLPEVSLWKAAHITGVVSAIFMISLGVLAATMVLAVGPDLPLARPLAIAGLLVFAALVASSVWRPRGLLRFRLPPLKAQVSLLAYAALDTAAAALTLYVLIPQALLPEPALFYTIFLLALGAGLLGTTPGGVGPFEMMFILCLPQLPEAPMLAAIMGYRLIYFALPALLATGVLIAGPALARAAETPGKTPGTRALPALRPAGTRPGQPVATTALSFNAPRAEAGLMRQGEFDLLYDAFDRPVSLVASAGQSLIMLSDPIGTDHCPGDALDRLHTVARHRFLTPCLYKCSARTATMARRAGWNVVQVAREARVHPDRFDLNAPACRQLRRQLRKAETAGVTVAEAGPRPPLQEMRDVARDWAAHRGAARGFSMGRFDAEYVSAQRVWLARHQGRLVGFVTFHEGWRERTLDLMCHRATAPAGSMHMLIARAIETAAAEHCPSLSLAAVPALSDNMRLPACLAARIDRSTGAAGLGRFKSAFAPRWEPLYLAAPGPLGLTLAGLDLVDRITRPRAAAQPLPDLQPNS